jgi:hypothetical protein
MRIAATGRSRGMKARRCTEASRREGREGRRRMDGSSDRRRTLEDEMGETGKRKKNLGRGNGQGRAGDVMWPLLDGRVPSTRRMFGQSRPGWEMDFARGRSRSPSKKSKFLWWRWRQDLSHVYSSCRCFCSRQVKLLRHRQPAVGSDASSDRAGVPLSAICGRRWSGPLAPDGSTPVGDATHLRRQCLR